MKDFGLWPAGPETVDFVLSAYQENESFRPLGGWGRKLSIFYAALIKRMKNLGLWPAGAGNAPFPIKRFLRNYQISGSGRLGRNGGFSITRLLKK